MLTHFGLDTLRAEWAQSVVCIGTFDGVHLGHQHVIGRALERAKAREMPCCLVTFDRHPAMTLAPEKAPPAIASLEQNLRRFRMAGVSVTLILAFDEALARMEAEAFSDRVLREALRAEQIVVGHDFAFGRGRAGTPEFLRARFETEVVAPFEQAGLRVSSTAIRQSIAEGRMPEARALLGRPFAMAGVVVPGQKLGRTLGFPTANLARSVAQVMPIDGVYASWVWARGRQFMGATSIGTRPAVGGTHRTVETFILDSPGLDLYGEAIEVGFVERLRPELPFDSLDALVAQMHLDIERARAILDADAALNEA